jgi:hypothetical protein
VVTAVGSGPPRRSDGFTPIVPRRDRRILPPDPRLEAVFGYEVFQCSDQTVGERP